MKLKTLLLAATFGLSTLSAATIGSFNLSGDIFVNDNSSITWTNDTTATSDQATISDATGIYASLDGLTATIDNLNSSGEPAGSPGFGDTLFITLPTIPTPTTLLINMIAAGNGGSTGCTQPPMIETPAQTCTPSTTTFVSPFVLTNGGTPSAITSTAGFSVSGDVVTSKTSGDTWTGVFTSQFTTPYQTVLAELAPGGSGIASDSYSATFTVSSNLGSSTPETSTLSMLALGLGLIVVGRSTRLIGRARR